MKTHLLTLHPFYLLQVAKALAAVGEKGMGGRRVNASVQSIIQPTIEQYDVLLSPLAKVSPMGRLNTERARASLTAAHEGNAERAACEPEWPHLPDPTLSVEVELAPLHLEHVVAAFTKWCDMEPDAKGPPHGIDRELVVVADLLAAAKAAGPTDNADLPALRAVT